MRTSIRAPAVVLLLGALGNPMAGRAARKPKLVGLIVLADPCTNSRRLPLCAGEGVRPDVSLCTTASDLIVQVRAGVTWPQSKRRSSRHDTYVNIRGTRVYVQCVVPMLPCLGSGGVDADRVSNGPTSH